MTLTSEQEKLVVDNTGIAHLIANTWRHGTHPIYLEDIHSVAIEALVKSTKDYDASKGFKFTTFASRVIENELIRYHKYNNRDKRKTLMSTLPLSSFTRQNNNGDESSDAEKLDLMIEHTEDHTPDDQMIVAQLLACLKDKDKEIVRLHYFDDLTMTEISKLYGVSRTAIYLKIRRINKKLKDKALSIGIESLQDTH